MLLVNVVMAVAGNLHFWCMQFFAHLGSESFWGTVIGKPIFFSNALIMNSRWHVHTALLDFIALRVQLLKLSCF